MPPRTTSPRTRSRPPGSARLRRELVEQFQLSGGASGAAVRRAFVAVPREHFIPEAARSEGLERVYRDQPVITARDERGAPTSSSSQPSLMASMLDALELRRGLRVLEVGAGTGYNAALLARIVGARGEVVSLELDPTTARRARRALTRAGSAARVVRADGRKGRPAAAPFDRIIVTASSPTVERAWHAQLAEGGLLELPLVVGRAAPAQTIVTLRKRGETLRSETLIPGGFMPLRARPGAPTPTPPPALSANEWLGERGRPIVHLSGEALRRLSRARRRRVLSLALSEPRTRRLGVRPRRGGLELYLAMEAPADRLVSAGPRVGVISKDGEGLALLAGGTTTFSRVETYGEGDAQRVLLALVEGWRELGRPALDDVRFELSFRAGEEPDLSWSWGD